MRVNQDNHKNLGVFMQNSTLQQMTIDNQSRYEPTTSDSYKVVSTKDLVAHIESQGFEKRQVQVTQSRDKARQGFTKHLVRFTPKDLSSLNVGDSVPEIVLRNSHDGKQALEIITGVFRLVCANGMMVGSSFGNVKVRHSGDTLTKVNEGIKKTLGVFPLVAQKIGTFKEKQLTQDETQYFLREASQLIVPSENAKLLDIQSLNHVRRQADEGQSLWLTFNRVQESLLRDSHKVLVSTLNESTGLKERSLSFIKSIEGSDKKRQNIDRIVNINRQLWDIASSLVA
jgi:hypothetical protein